MEQFGDRHATAQKIQEGVWEGEQSTRPPLARLLQEEGLATRERVEEALAEGARTGERLGEVLLRWQLVDERQLARLLARQWHLPFLDEQEVVPERAALTVLAAADAQRLAAVPVFWQDGVLRVVVAEPTEERLAEVHARIPQGVAFAVVTSGTLERLLARGEVPPAEAAQGPSGENPVRGFDELVDLLDDETAHLHTLCERVQQFAAFVADRDQTAVRLENELDAARAAREQNLRTIDRLRAEVEERDRLLSLVSSKVEELGSALGAGRAR
jgi:Type II secretion system (T2SS), protein E, N-terminal domain